MTNFAWLNFSNKRMACKHLQIITKLEAFIKVMLNIYYNLILKHQTINIVFFTLDKSEN